MLRAPIAAVLVAAAVGLAACGGAEPGSPAGAGQLGHGAEAFPPGIVAFADVDADTGDGAWKKVDTLLGRFPSWPKVEAQIQKSLAEASSDGGSFNADVKPWLGDEAAVGLYGVTVGGAGQQPVPQWAAFIASKDDGKARDSLAASKQATKTGSYKGYDVYRETSGDMVAAIGKGAVLLAGDVATLQKSIDAREGDSQLAGDDTYKQTLDKLPADSVAIAFVDWQKVAGLLQLAVSAAGSQAGAAGSQLAPLLAQYDGVQALGFSAGATDTGFQFKSAVVGSLPAMSGKVTLLSSLPASSLVAVDGATGGAVSDQLSTALSGNPQAAAALGMLTQQTGIDLAKDLPPLLSGEIALYAAPGTPVSGAILLKPKDADAATAALDRIVAGLGKTGAPAPQPLPDGAHGGSIDRNGTQISWRRDGDVITIGYQTGGAATTGGLTDSAAFKRTADAAGMSGDQSAVAYVDIPAIVALAKQMGRSGSAEALANLGALGGLLLYGPADGQTLFLEVPAPA